MRFPANFRRSNEGATPFIIEDALLPFDLPAGERKKVTADFVDGSISSGGGVELLGAAGALVLPDRDGAGCIRNWRDP